MSNLANQLVIAEREEVARGVRLLLAAPLLSESATPEAFDLVRRRREPIGKWFDYYCGWSLVVEPRLGYARLVKVRAKADPSRPARRSRSGRAAFDRRRYTLLCLVAAELLAAPVTTIGLLADRVTQATAADPLIDAFDTAVRAERMAYVDVLRMLESYGAIEVVDGSTDSFVGSEGAKVLYRVDSTLVMRLLAAPNGASQFSVPVEEIPVRFDELMAALRRERRYGDAPDAAHAADGASDVQRNLWLRHSVFRRVVDDPVVYRDELSAAELAYVSSPTGRQLLKRAAEQGGFLLEERAEGFLFVDPDGLATDGKFPDDSSNAKVAALLLLDVITAADGGVAPEQLNAEAARLLREFPKWAKGYRGEDGKEQLVADAVAVLSDFGLARHSGELVVALPAASRYAVTGARSSEETR
ncbi:TIGR02678 family protein [Amycolatopsis sp. H20-H5]|uniref:TIGR02678 family protein n=1 Tax=Amycolatopsis sp. H20-H5 TaxID=3046309 RepID=UPI002DB9AA88|nr:TIGR02678 family protein [Amycolatopsis sp. H20-H5]MEC3977964.1 TIGR02678 family protein [Amycolatopsis sp. H20-H5]